MTKQQPSKRQPLIGDICPMCKSHFKYHTGKPRELAEAAVYIGIADVWLHGGYCHTQWYEWQASANRQTIREDES